MERNMTLASTPLWLALVYTACYPLYMGKGDLNLAVYLSGDLDVDVSCRALVTFRTNKFYNVSLYIHIYI
jgi:hypothetical protein